MYTPPVNSHARSEILAKGANQPVTIHIDVKRPNRASGASPPKNSAEAAPDSSAGKPKDSS
jgi:hypothetical protein